MLAQEQVTSNGTAIRSLWESEKNIVRQVLQATIPIKVANLLQTMLKLRMEITNIVSDDIVIQKQCKPQEEELTGKPPPEGNEAIDPMLLTVSIERKPVVVKLEIMGQKLANTIIDGGSGVNVVSEETWKCLGKSKLWPSTFHLVGANQHGIKSLGTLMEKKVMIGTQQFFLDFVFRYRRSRTMHSLGGDA